MKVIGFSGSPRKDANTDRLVRAALAGAAAEGAETRFVRIADLNLKGCVSCFYCRAHEACSIKDDMQGLYPELFAADAVVLGSPVYMGQMTGQTKTFVDRLFPVMNPDFTSRLKKRPGLLLAFTQGQPDLKTFMPYIESTQHMLGFLGFTPRGILVAGGTRNPDDVDRQVETLGRARAAGAALVRESRSPVQW